MYSGGDCGRDVERDGSCIFHIHDKTEGDSALFKKKFESYLDECRKQEKKEIDFTLFVFPNIPIAFSSESSPQSYSANLIFKGANISGPLSFAYASFVGTEINFQSSCFRNSGILDLSFTTFGHDSKLVVCDAHLSDQSSVSLLRASFEKDSIGADFARTTFSGKSSAQVSRVNFGQFTELSFEKVVFEDDSVALLSFATFCGARIDFTGATFRDRALLEVSRTTMLETEAYFLNASFENETKFNFAYSNLYGRTKVIFADSLLADGYFQWVDIDKNAEMTFGSFSRKDPLDLSKTSFLQTDVRRINFGNVKWGTIPPGSVVDERFLKDRDGPPYKAVVTLYRRLRENYERQLRYTEASDFFVREMELMRTKPSFMGGKMRLSKILRWLGSWFSVGAVYYVLAKYGEDYSRAIIWSLLSIFLIYPAFRLAEQCLATCSRIQCILSNYPVHVEIATRIFFQVFELSSLDFPDILFRIWSGLLLAVLFIALKRKYERRR